MDEEFTDIPISDVTLTCDVIVEDGRLLGSLGIQYSEPLPLALYSIWATETGEPVGVAGLNDHKSPRYGRFQVLVATDQRAMWGRKCPHCDGYWRTATPGFAATAVCCYCGGHSASHECLSDAQRAYVRAACGFFTGVLEQDKAGHWEIRARELLDRGIAEGMPATPPEFFVEKSKQTKFTCESCGNLNDILGRFAFCSGCGTRNDLAMLEADVEALRNAVNGGSIQLATALKEAVDGFDTIGRNIARQLCALVPMTPARYGRWEKANFAQLDDIATGLKADFDIDVLKGLDTHDRSFTNRMFHRRHLHSHKGGVVDRKYLADTGDTSVETGQLLKETQGDIHRLLGCVTRIAKNLLAGFHEIIPVLDGPIAHQRDKLAAIKRNR